MKALILAAGRGSRLGEETTRQNKCMLELGGRPIIGYAIENASRAGVEEAILVVGYCAEGIINYYGISHDGTKLQYVIQREQLGIVHAIECAAEQLGGHDFLLMLGDVMMIEPKHTEMIAAFEANKPFGLCGVVDVGDRERITKTFTVATAEDGSIVRLVEKPRHPFHNNLMGTGEGVFRNEILKYTRLTPPSIRRHERELTDLVQCAVDDGHRVEPFLLCKDYVNVNTHHDIMHFHSMNR
jgi:NDP-sugar pyrophosphorylase family protein